MGFVRVNWTIWYDTILPSLRLSLVRVFTFRKLDLCVHCPSLYPFAFVATWIGLAINDGTTRAKNERKNDRRSKCAAAAHFSPPELQPLTPPR